MTTTNKSISGNKSGAGDLALSITPHSFSSTATFAASAPPPAAFRAAGEARRNVIAPLQPQYAHTHTAPGEAETASTLVHELMSENCRLEDEVAFLRRALQQQQQDQQQQLQQRQHQQQTRSPSTGISRSSAAQHSGGEAISSPATGVQVSSTNPPPHQQEGKKFVCCGKCRQWLEAPREANYVFCPGCESINNCALAPAPTPPRTAQVLAVRTPPARSVWVQGWDCIAGMFQ